MHGSMLGPEQLLLIAIGLPLFGAALIVVHCRPDGRLFARQSALVTAILTLLAAGWLLVQFSNHGTEPFAATDLDWFSDPSGIHIRFAVALDGLSAWLFGLSALLVVTCVLVSWEAIQDRAPSFYAMLLLLETGLLGVFAARDIILFYIFFEFTLIPLFFLIGIWGSEQRRYAAIKFFIFTLIGSLLTLLGLLVLIIWNSQHPAPGRPAELTFSIPDLTASLQAAAAAGDGIPVAVQIWIFGALFAGFAIKVPLFPLHTWLPLAHTEAPTAGSVLLAGILLKIGTYGFLRFSIPMLPEATAVLMPTILWLAVAGIIYGAFVALAQSDIKRLIAYSSVSHLGFCMLGLFALNPLAVEGGALQMINHGLSTGGLFACVGMLYERYHTRQIRDYSGMARKLPILAFFLVIFTLSSIGLPGLNGFAGEFLLLVGAFQRAFTHPALDWGWQLKLIAILATLGVVLGAWYMLWLIQRTFFGPLKEPVRDDIKGPVRDLSFREIAALVPLVVLIVWIGIQPQAFLAPMRPALRDTTSMATVAYERGPQLAEVDWNIHP
ncbi:MAG: NADH-quinone oxidoreductase subunit M [Pirellulales bacterium]|nr:NADH-quinone oxidoreductase subunit M [Pirellulales bacterium]